MEIIDPQEARYGKGQRVRLLIKALYLPLLAIFFIALSLASLLFLPSGVTRISIWVHDAGSDLGKRIVAIDFDTPVHVVPAGAGGEESPSNCTGNVWQVVTEASARQDGDILYGQLASAGISACSGLSYEFNTSPTDSSSVAKWLIGWPHFLLLVCGVAAAIVIYRRHGDFQRGKVKEPAKWVKVCVGLIGAVLACLCAELIARVFQGGGEEYIPFARSQNFAVLPLVAASVLIPFLEEVSFRAWLIPFAEKAVGTAAAVVFSAVTFSLSHGTYEPDLLVFYAAAGVVLSWVWVRTRSLLACVVAHGLYNTWVTFIAFG